MKKSLVSLLAFFSTASFIFATDIREKDECLQPQSKQQSSKKSIQIENLKTNVNLSTVQATDQKDDRLGITPPHRASDLRSPRPWDKKKTLNNTEHAKSRNPQSWRPWHNQNASTNIVHAERKSPQSWRSGGNHDTSNNTEHAEIRKKQREISNQDIQTTKQDGKKEEHKNSITYTNEKTKVVTGKSGKVITVIDNKRNTNFDLLQMSKNKEKQLLKKVAYQNNDSAMCELAELYLSGKLGNRDIQTAHDFLLRAADRDNSHAMCLLSNLYENGDLGKVDQDASLEWLEKATKRNNLGAMAKLGQYYFSKYLKVKNLVSIDEQEKNNLIQKTKCFLERAADRGQTRAIWTIAKIHEEGYFGEKNLPKAIEIYTKAARLGSPSSLDSLNELVLAGEVNPEHLEAILDELSLLWIKTSRGLAVEMGLKQIFGQLGRNSKRGFEMIKRVAEIKDGNNADAIRELAKCYRDGKGCETDLSLAQYWFQQLEVLYKKAAQQGNVEAMLDLGFLYLKDSLGKINLERADQSFIQAANTGDILCISMLGELYITGELGDKEPSVGIEWLNKAGALWSERAAHGDIEAIESLIHLYLDEDNLGVKDYQAAAKWLSARLEHSDTVRLRSDILRLADGYRKKSQYAEAEYWYSILANKKHPRALESLARMHQKGQLAIDSNKERIDSWALQLQLELHKRAEKSPMAALHLAKLYEKGDLLPKKIGEAVKLLFLASSSVANEYSDAIELSRYHLNKLLKFKDFTIEEKQEIIQGILHYKDNEEKPYRVGRILGDIYSQGILIEPNYQEALFWYEKAAKYGNSIAMYHISVLHEKGVFGGINLPKAIEWYDLSAAAGNEKAIECLRALDSAASLDDNSKIITEKWAKQVPLLTIVNDDQNKTVIGSRPKDPREMYHLGEKYRNGSLEKDGDPLLAAYWFRKASQKDHAESAFALGNMYASGELGQNVKSVGIRRYKEAAENDHIAAMKKLYDIYTDGIIVAPNLNKANKWKSRVDEQVFAESL